jgi:hypothetical protein
MSYFRVWLTHSSFRLSDPPLHYVGRFCSTWVRGLVSNWALQKDPPSHPYPTCGEKGTKKMNSIKHTQVCTEYASCDHRGFNNSVSSGGFLFYCLTFLLIRNVMIEWASLLSPGFKSRTEIGYPDFIRRFLQYLNLHTGLIPQIRARPLPAINFRIHFYYFSYHLTLNTINVVE